MIVNRAHVIIITGDVGSGKTLFLSNILPRLKSHWSVDGFICLTEGKNRSIGESASHYKIKFVDSSSLFSWAKKKESTRGYDLNEQTQQLVTGRLLDSNKDIIILDDLGPYELIGEGFSQLFTDLKENQETILLCVVKKRVLKEFQEKFNIQEVNPYDLDEQDHKECEKRLYKELLSLDNEKIGLYSTVNGFTEITLGSFLHSIHLPLKGHVLALLQNFLLIQYAKDLKGRGLYLIALISAGIKSFSPAGSKLKPMFYIFIQGVFFALPISIMGVNLISVIIGSLLMSITTVYLSLLLNYLIFGYSYLESMENILRVSIAYLEAEQISFWTLVLIGACLKGIVTLCVSIPAYTMNFQSIVDKIKAKVESVDGDNQDQQVVEIKTSNWRESVRGSIRDLSVKKFIIPFVLTSFVIYFFTHLSLRDFSFVIIRALLISWFGFVLARRINFVAISSFLGKRGLEHWAVSLESAIKTIQRLRDR